MWKLMHDNAIGSHDKKLMCDFINSGAKLSYGQKVKDFETLWSKWLGVKYSVYVNSGSSANLLLVQAMHDLHGRGDWIAQSCTWATNVAPIMQLRGMKDNGKLQEIYLTDVNMKTLGLDETAAIELIKTNRDIKFIFVTHVLGIPSISQELLKICRERGVIILEDCCEAHGSTIHGRKVGTLGKASTFSFFYGHHITTVEGGMISTDDEELYEHLLLLRSHGLLRELPENSRIKRKVKDVDERFTFLCCGYNFRNTDLHAVLGISQMDRLESSISIRNRNFERFISRLNSESFHTDMDTHGVSLFAFPVICKRDSDLRNKVSIFLNKIGVEHRPLIAGNLLRHPMLKSHVNAIQCPNADKIHFNSFYVGNNETVTIDQVDLLVDGLNSL
jgi:CDP-6-deoxy-D-xylo-4-hexulose-3-dehydrase